MNQKATAHGEAPDDFAYRWHVMAAVAASTFLSTIDGSIVNVALPSLVRALRTDFATVQWVVLAYLLTQATLLPGMGRLGDMVGKKGIYAAGIALFTLGSALCGLAPTVGWLIGFRVLQAVGAAMALALGMAIITEAFPPQERGKALGLNGTFVSVGIVVGPTLGGLLLDALSWHWIFYVNLPVGVVGLWLVWRYVPASSAGPRPRFDFAGAALLFVTLLCLLLALTLGQRLGFLAPPILLLGSASLLFVALFLRVEWRHPRPMISLRLFRHGLFSTGLFTGFMAFVTIAGATLLLPFYLENMRGYAPAQVGLMMAIIPVFLGVLAPLAGALSDRYGTRPIATLGLVIVAGGYVLMSRFDTQTGLAAFAAGVLPLGIGMGIFQSPNNSAVMGAVSEGQLGVASGLLGLSRTLGQTTGIALLGAFWAARVAAEAPAAAGGTAGAPVAAQIAGLHDTFLLMVALTLLSLAASLWDWRRRRTVAGPARGR